MPDVTRLLSAIERGDPQASEQLLPLVYEELRRLAAQKMAQEKPGQTLQATALVHEAYLRLVGAGAAQHWDSRGHFYSAAAEAMRRILIEQARRKNSLKTGAGMHRISLSDVHPTKEGSEVDVLAVDEVLQKLARSDPRKAELVKLRFFAGLTNAQAAAILGIDASTAALDWAYAKCWLRVEMS